MLWFLIASKINIGYSDGYCQYFWEIIGRTEIKRSIIILIWYPWPCYTGPWTSSMAIIEDLNFNPFCSIHFLGISVTFSNMLFIKFPLHKTINPQHNPQLSIFSFPPHLINIINRISNKYPYYRTDWSPVKIKLNFEITTKNTTQNS